MKTKTIYKTFRFKLKENATQQRLFYKFAGSCRFLYNYGLNERIETYRNEKLGVSYFKQAKNLTALKKTDNYKWLCDVNTQILQQSLLDLNTAFKNFFRSNKNGGAHCFPKFKKKGIKDSFRYMQGFKINNDKIYLPNIGWVKFINHQKIDGKICEVIVKREGKNWFIHLSCEINIDDKKIQIIDEDRIVGIDVGIKKFAVLSTGEEIDNQKFLPKAFSKLKKEQRKLSKKILKSNNWKKQMAKVSKLHIKIKNCRKDFLHKISANIVKNHDIISVEDLEIKRMVDNKKFLSKSIYDSSWGTFIEILKYKSDWNNKYFIKIGRYEPTSKTCSNCGHIKSMPLSERTYDCDSCGMIIDRDLNASLNIKAAGLVVFNACGGVG